MRAGAGKEKILKQKKGILKLAIGFEKTASAEF